MTSKEHVNDPGNNMQPDCMTFDELQHSKYNRDDHNQCDTQSCIIVIGINFICAKKTYSNIHKSSSKTPVYYQQRAIRDTYFRISQESVDPFVTDETLISSLLHTSYGVILSSFVENYCKLINEKLYASFRNKTAFTKTGIHEDTVAKLNVNGPNIIENDPGCRIYSTNFIFKRNRNIKSVIRNQLL